MDNRRSPLGIKIEESESEDRAGFFVFTGSDSEPWRRRRRSKELQRDLENQANALSKIQKDISKNHQVRKQYTIQLGENELVLKELDLLKEDANVYKLIGPVLVKQDLAEARGNVGKRIEYISAELKRLEGTLQDLEDKQNSKKESIFKLRQKMETIQAGKS
ncbi:LOW QUALITY PROTEIN: prefoldin subunit 6-like [Dioscorea cayenensis subsp. rotundata]|uniref:LOW QUALITY PROTEIN: prefoldin subunit 6-like n=1 Tax=Dioscorea cayennensis subsp. rotundata TaxID=55577 RepID=A0AB40B4N0_DIOCR|nr:LOW QUALITY PROTEIN: prefoldin subunit 6-like [Dioscorea cayenensis subsp. rotundata]